MAAVPTCGCLPPALPVAAVVAGLRTAEVSASAVLAPATAAAVALHASPPSTAVAVPVSAAVVAVASATAASAARELTKLELAQRYLHRPYSHFRAFRQLNHSPQAAQQLYDSLRQHAAAMRRQRLVASQPQPPQQPLESGDALYAQLWPAFIRDQLANQQRRAEKQAREDKKRARSQQPPPQQTTRKRRRTLLTAVETASPSQQPQAPDPTPSLSLTGAAEPVIVDGHAKGDVSSLPSSRTPPTPSPSQAAVAAASGVSSPSHPSSSSSPTATPPPSLLLSSSPERAAPSNCPPPPDEIRHAFGDTGTDSCLQWAYWASQDSLAEQLRTGYDLNDQQWLNHVVKLIRVLGDASDLHRWRQLALACRPYPDRAIVEAAQAVALPLRPATVEVVTRRLDALSDQTLLRVDALFAQRLDALSNQMLRRIDALLRITLDRDDSSEDGYPADHCGQEVAQGGGDE